MKSKNWSNDNEKEAEDELGGWERKLILAAVPLLFSSFILSPPPPSSMALSARAFRQIFGVAAVMVS